MKRYFFLFAILFIQLSCNESNTKQVEVFFGIVHTTLYESSQVQQRFIDKATEAILKIESDNNASIDTKELRVLLDSARNDVNSGLNVIKMTREVDSKIDLKNKATDYMTLLISCYDNEFTEFINILESSTENKFDKAIKILKTKLTEIKDSRQVCIMADKELQKKYDLHTTEE